MTLATFCSVKHDVADVRANSMMNQARYAPCAAAERDRVCRGVLGLVGEYAGDVGLYAGLVGEYLGEVGL